ncbi:hypothetical protein E4U53_006514 [Claviceps sorghi]|nr:hypothetical protein E4U53_006514 [Claviceps sorghi]
MALIRIKDVRREGWDAVWARYYTQRPFPTPTCDMRKTTLLALAAHFQSTDMSAMEWYITVHGFDKLPQVQKDEAMAIAPRLHEAVDVAVECHESSEEETAEFDDDEEDE